MANRKTWVETHELFFGRIFKVRRREGSGPRIDAEQMYNFALEGGETESEMSQLMGFGSGYLGAVKNGYLKKGQLTVGLAILHLIVYAKMRLTYGDMDFTLRDPDTKIDEFGQVWKRVA